MRIAFVGPQWNQMVNSYPPLGIAYLAAVARQEGHEPAIFDFGLYPERPLEEEIRLLLAWKPDLVAFTSMTTSHHSIEQIAAAVKEAAGVTTIIGGPHATTLPEMTLSDPNIDFLAFGEGEATFREFLQAYTSGSNNWADVPGLWYKDEKGNVLPGSKRALIRDLDSLPFPARDLFELKRYPLYAPDGEQMLTLLSSRGCPYNCSFCFKGIVGRTYRRRSPENVVAEIEEMIRRYGVRNFYFIDDLFTIDVRSLNKLMDKFEEHKLDIRFRCLARVDRVTPELLERLYKNGCRQIHYGIESGNPEVLKRTAKNIKLEQVVQAVDWTAEVGIASKGYFILGLPGDTEETIEQTINFAASLPLTEAMFSIATPFPGTRMWEDLLRKKPELKYTADFTKTYYYTSYLSDIAPFLNVSEVADEKLSHYAVIARRRFLEAKAHRLYQQSFGKEVGDFLWKVRRNDALRTIGRGLTTLGLFSKFKRNKERGEAELWA